MAAANLITRFEPRLGTHLGSHIPHIDDAPPVSALFRMNG